jgi:amidophosphoribosyltransferase
MNIEQILTFIVKTIPAAYCLILLLESKIYAVRDRYGIRPMCLGRCENGYYVSSESHGLGDVPFLRDVAPGEVLRIDKNGITSISVHPTNQLSLCTFEILYFANENSVIDGYNIKKIRKQLAIRLSEREKLTEKDYIVIGIPATGRLLGQTYANAAGLDYRQWITKNPNVDRTFILKTDKERKEACMKKFFYDKSHLKGKKVILVDDTIVRGNVICAIIENLRKIGVAEVHVRIPAPPVVERCILGISIQDKKELITSNRSVNEVSREINANSLSYLSIDDISDFVPEKSYNLCFSGCVEKNIIACPRIDLRESGFNNKNGTSLFL